ncbi:hypothetical protein ADUPG1_005847, partial [Aduncisulcus paluster]
STSPFSSSSSSSSSSSISIPWPPTDIGVSGSSVVTIRPYDKADKSAYRPMEIPHLALDDPHAVPPYVPSDWAGVVYADL